jgi:hypothetical protein
MQGESGALRKFLKLFGCFSKALDWVYGFLKRLGFKSSFGLKCRVSNFVAGQVIQGYKATLKGFWFRLGPVGWCLSPMPRGLLWIRVLSPRWFLVWMRGGSRVRVRV